jgi:hypothetical protein
MLPVVASQSDAVEGGTLCQDTLCPFLSRETSTGNIQIGIKTLSGLWAKQCVMMMAQASVKRPIKMNGRVFSSMHLSPDPLTCTFTMVLTLTPPYLDRRGRGRNSQRGHSGPTSGAVTRLASTLPPGGLAEIGRIWE